MSTVLIGQAYHLRFDPKLWNAMEPYPPLGTLYAASVLRDNGFDVAFHDSMLANSEGEWIAALDRVRPDYAVLYEDNFNYLSKMCLLRMREAAITMTRAAKEYGCTVVVCGSDATDRPEIYLHAGADVVLLGEGEETLIELMRAEMVNHAIEGIAFLNDGELLRTPRRQVMRDLDRIPFPAWDLIDVHAYRELWQRRHGYFSMNMATSRGCPFHCNWCAKPIWGQRYNTRSPENVADELDLLRKRYEPDHIWFMDDMMGIKPGWMERFATLVNEKGIRTPFKCLNRVDLLLRDGEIDALRRAGCEIVWTGVESGSQKILDAMDKGIRLDQIHEASRRLHSAGIQVGFFLQFGYPGETRDDIEKTFQIVRECEPDRIGVSVSYPLPGTKFYDVVRSQLGSKRNWTDSDDLAMMYRGPFATEFYRQAHAALHKEFRMRKAASKLLDHFRRASISDSAAPLRHGGSFRRPTRSGNLRRLLVESAALVFHAATLPVARLRMERASRLPHVPIEPVEGALTPVQAATPSSQESAAA